MYFDDFLSKVVDANEMPSELKFEFALYPSNSNINHYWWREAPVKITSLGDFSGSVIILPSWYKNPLGNLVKVVDIENRLFAKQTQITDIILPSYLRSKVSHMSRIYGRIFLSCENLKRVYIPQGFCNLTKDTFKKCHAMEDVYYGGSEQDWMRNLDYVYNAELNKAQIHFDCHMPNELRWEAKYAEVK